MVLGGGVVSNEPGTAFGVEESLQGYLTQNSPPLPSAYASGPGGVLGRWAVSCGRGIPVRIHTRSPRERWTPTRLANHSGLCLDVLWKPHNFASVVPSEPIYSHYDDWATPLVARANQPLKVSTPHLQSGFDIPRIPHTRASFHLSACPAQLPGD